MNPISINNVSFAYVDARRAALRDLSFDVPTGQICAVVGRAGAGKSTLCALCAGFIPQFYNGEFRGTAQVDGQNVIEQNISDLVRHVGLVSSNPFSQVSGARFSVFEEVAFGLENIGLPRDEIITRTEWALEALGIAHLRDRSPFELSGGQQQRMVIAASLALKPPVLVLDEPTTQLDPPSVEELAELLRNLARAGTTILVAEHRLEWVAALADRVLVLDEGHLIADGTPHAVFSNPMLLERHVGWPRPAIIASKLQEQGDMPTNTPLPVTEDELLRAIHVGSIHAGLGLQGGDTFRPGSPSTVNGLRSIVELDNVRFAYPSGVEALKGVSFAVGKGERITILGRNGAGKSTLVRHFNGLLKPTSGQVLVVGSDTRRTSMATNSRHVGIVFQDVRNQLFARTVREELRFGPRNLRFDARKTDALVEKALDALDLHEIADAHPYDLPLATRRLVAVAAVLTMDTPVLVLDEPTAGLDIAAVERLTRLCHNLAAAGKSVVVITHDLDFSFEALERVVLMRDGQIIVDTPWQALAPPPSAACSTKPSASRWRCGCNRRCRNWGQAVRSKGSEARSQKPGVRRRNFLRIVINIRAAPRA